MKAYVTKYALTTGIEVVDGEVTDGGYLHVDGCYSLFRDSEYFETEKEAREDAERRRVKKIESLNKQINKLLKLSVKIKE